MPSTSRRDPSTILVFAVTAACSEPVVEYEGLHVVLGADPELEPCAGTISHMDEFIVRLSDKFGLKLPLAEDRIRFRWVRQSDFASIGCPSGSLGCTSGSHVDAWQAPLNHELVHAVASSVGRPRAFFAEGLAHAYEGLSRDDIGVGASASQIIPSITLNSSNIDRLTAGAFVAFLVERHGAARFLHLYEEMPRVASVARIERLFLEIFSVTLAESITEFEAGHEGCRHDEYDAKLIECAAPEIEWDAGRIALFRSLDCEQQDAIGPYDGSYLQIFHSLVVPSDGEYEVNVIGDIPDDGSLIPPRVDLNPCGSCIAGLGTSIHPGERARIPLTAGRYALRLRGPATVTTSIGFTLERVNNEALP